MKPTGKEIGCGAYGRVFEVEHEKTRYAAKEIHALLLQFARSDPESLKKLKADFFHECQVWSLLQHSRIVQFIGKLHLYSDPVLATLYIFVHCHI